jgi:hypothetical protein
MVTCMFEHFEFGDHSLYGVVPRLIKAFEPAVVIELLSRIDPASERAGLQAEPCPYNEFYWYGECIRASMPKSPALAKLIFEKYSVVRDGEGVVTRTLKELVESACENKAIPLLQSITQEYKLGRADFDYMRTMRFLAIEKKNAALFRWLVETFKYSQKQALSDIKGQGSQEFRKWCREQFKEVNAG